LPVQARQWRARASNFSRPTTPKSRAANRKPC